MACWCGACAQAALLLGNGDSNLISLSSGKHNINSSFQRLFDFSCSEQNIQVALRCLPLWLCLCSFLHSCPFLRGFVHCLQALANMMVTCTLGVTVTALAGQWALLLFAVNASFIPDEKSLSLEVTLNHQVNEPLLKSDFSVTCCYHLAVLASNRIIYPCMLIPEICYLVSCFAV